jgi:hypothetical protein
MYKIIRTHTFYTKTQSKIGFTNNNSLLIMFGLIFWVPNELIVRCVETYWSNYHKLTLHLNYPIMFQLTIDI